MLEQFYTCPYCATDVSLLVDAGAEHQVVIEDCERCCQPIEFSISVQENEVSAFSYQPIEQ